MEPRVGACDNPGCDQKEVFSEMKARVVSEFETNYLQSLLLAYRGNISKAAEAAQKERRTFWELIRKHNIDVQKFKVANAGNAGAELR